MAIVDKMSEMIQGSLIEVIEIEIICVIENIHRLLMILKDEKMIFVEKGTNQRLCSSLGNAVAWYSVHWK